MGGTGIGVDIRHPDVRIGIERQRPRAGNHACDAELSEGLFYRFAILVQNRLAVGIELIPLHLTAHLRGNLVETRFPSRSRIRGEIVRTDEIGRIAGGFLLKIIHYGGIEEEIETNDNSRLFCPVVSISYVNLIQLYRVAIWGSDCKAWYLCGVAYYIPVTIFDFLERDAGGLEFVKLGLAERDGGTPW